MTFGLSGAAIAGLAVGGATVYAANKSAGAARDAAAVQSAAADAGIAEQQRQFDIATEEQRKRFDQIQQLLSPFVTAGTGSLSAQEGLIGLNGQDAQQQAISTLQRSPVFTALQKQGEDAILASASATGGLRGGNVQAALAQFRPQLLAQLINDQYTKLGGITSLGQNSAALTGNAGMQTGQGIASGALQTGANVGNLLQQQGAALAGGALADGRAAAAIPNALLSGLGIFKGMGGKF